VEVLEERKDLLYDAIEDVAFARAIEEGAEILEPDVRKFFLTRNQSTRRSGH
jgi:hypothetical protein